MTATHAVLRGLHPLPPSADLLNCEESPTSIEINGYERLPLAQGRQPSVVKVFVQIVTGS
jgi:hypothetical protein